MSELEKGTECPSGHDSGRDSMCRRCRYTIAFTSADLAAAKAEAFEEAARIALKCAEEIANRPVEIGGYAYRDERSWGAEEVADALRARASQEKKP